MIHLPESIAVSTPRTHASSSGNEAAYLVLGNPTDVVTNGEFAADSDWTKGTNWTIGSGKATRTNNGGDLTQANVLIVGNWYLVIFELETRTAGSTRLDVGATQGISRSVVGIYAEILQCTTTTTIAFTSTSSFAGSVDNCIIYDLTSDADVGFQVVDAVQGSYDATPVGALEIASSAGTTFRKELVVAKPFVWPRRVTQKSPPLAYSNRNKPLVIVLHAGGAAVSGTLNAQTR